MPDLTAFFAHNPFSHRSIGDQDVWGEVPFEPFDITEIHATESEWLEKRFNRVVTDERHPTTVAHLIGPSGSGKSHLIARLRAAAGFRANFTFVANPPNQPEALVPFILSQVVRDLRRPIVWHAGGDPSDDSCRRSLLCGAAHRELRIGSSPEEASRVLAKMSCNELAEVVNRLTETFEDKNGYEFATSRALASLLDPQKERVAARWLSGSEDISDEELDTLNLKHPLSPGQAVKVLGILGVLSTKMGRPMILTLDQLDDAVAKPDQVAEFGRLLVELTDYSRGWFVVVSLIYDLFDQIWKTHLSPAARSKIGLDGSESYTRIRPLVDPHQKTLILKARLADHSLVELRRQAGIHDNLSPIKEKNLAELSTGEPTYPRALLRQAERVFAECCSVAVQPEPLVDLVKREFEVLLKQTRENMPDPSATILANRLREAVEAVLLARGVNGLEVEKGGAAPGRVMQDAADWVYRINSNETRVFGHDRQAGGVFAKFLEVVINIHGKKLLVRDGRVPDTGNVAQKRLGIFRERGNVYVHLNVQHLATLHAVGRFMAAIRDNTYSDEHACPDPTPEELKRCLGTQDALEGNPAVASVLRALDMK